MSSTLPMIEPQMTAKKLQLESKVPDDLLAKADRDKVQQVVLNLLTNATKFTAPGGSVRVEATPRGEQDVVLSVTDTGIGIPENMVQKVFEPFIQVDTTHSRAGEGTGLGLAISRDLARGMGGDLSAQSAVGVGSAFHLVLPRFTLTTQPR
jgi:signal transduction histidine kinase